MVLEQLFKLEWIEKREHAFFLGFLYSLVGILSAWFIFPLYVGLTSIAFISILLIPSLNVLLRLGENAEIREKKFSLKLLINDHKDIIKIYFFMFIGIFFAYSMVTFLFPRIAISTLFEPQLRSATVRGLATFRSDLSTIIVNNAIILMICFFLSLIYGAGSIFFLTWNASVWGVFFTFFVKQIATVQGGNPILIFLNLSLPFLPHLTTEALGYVTAAIAGGIVSKAVLREKLFSKKFYHIINDSIIFLILGLLLIIIAAIVEVRLYSSV